MDRSTYPMHADLLEQVADSTEERDNVRRILGGLTEADLDAAQKWRQAPYPFGATNHAHRYSACASGPCEQGRKPCPSPQQCMRPDDGTDPGVTLLDLWIGCTPGMRIGVAIVGAVVLVLLIVHVVLRVA